MPTTANRSRPNRQRRPAGDTAPPPSAGPGTPLPSPPPRPVYDDTPRGVESIGEILRRRRQQRGDDLQQIADYLCIRKGFLVALENSDYDELPADAYVIGFLRSYANYLGFDGADAINRYRGEMTGRRRKPTLVLPTPIAEGRTPSPAIMIGAVVLAIVIYAAWYGFSAADRAAVSAPPPLPSTPASANANPAPVPGGIALPAPPPNDAVVSSAPSTQAPLASVTSSAPPAEIIPGRAIADQQPAAAPAAAEQQPATNTRLVIRAEKETWVAVADGKGKTLLDRVMKPGDMWPVPDQAGLKLTAGNSSGIILVLDGKDLPKLARNSSVLRDIPIDIDKLGTPKPKTPPPVSQE